jgi:hypothetical protein
MFQEKSNLLLYREVDWNPDRIPDSATRGVLASLRLSQTPIIVDAAGVKRFERTELVKRFLARGVPEDGLVAGAEALTNANKESRASGAEHVAIMQAAQPEWKHSISGVCGSVSGAISRSMC